MLDNIHYGNSKKQDLAADLLKIVPRLPRSILRDLEASSSMYTYAPGRTIIKEGEPIGGILLLLKGTVHRCMSGLTLLGKKCLNLPAVSAPAAIGTASCLLEERSAFTITAYTPTEVILIPRELLLRVLGHSPETALALLQLLGNELAQTYACLATLRSGSIMTPPSPLLN